MKRRTFLAGSAAALMAATGAAAQVPRDNGMLALLFAGNTQFWF